MKTIDCTPTWTSLVPFMLEVLCEPKHSHISRELIKEQIYVMAKAADLYINSQKTNENEQHF